MRVLLLAASLAFVCGCAGHAVPTARTGIDPNAERAARVFIAAAVDRQDLAAAWDLADPAFRQGFTKSNWLNGIIPVQWYPVDRSVPLAFRLRRRAPLTIEVYLTSRHTAGEVFWIGLVRRHNVWRIRSFTPVGSLGPIAPRR